MSVDEAVDWVMKAETREYRQKCLNEWRNKISETFANEVEMRVKKLWGKRKK